MGKADGAVVVTLAKIDGVLELVENFIPDTEAQQMLERLLRELAWHDEDMVMFGKTIRVPRRVCWYGDPGAAYTYSGTHHDPLPWTPLLQDLKHRIEQFTQHSFNSVLGNLYRDGNDSMGWHADKEKELGAQPFIASLSFGVTRHFRAHHKKSGQRLVVPLHNGSLLTMGGVFQKHWRHAVPKEIDVTQPRINLTFRNIITP